MAKSYKKSMYKMKGCAKKGKKGGSKKGRYTKKTFRGGCGSCSSSNLLKGGSRKKRRGGDLARYNLAYTGTPASTVRNPFLSYTGKGGNKQIPNIPNANPNPGPLVTKNNFVNLHPNPITTQNGGSYPNGLTGDPWTPSVQTWPGVNGVNGDNNHYELNTYDNDVSRQMVDVGPSTPYAVGGRRKRRYRKGGMLFGSNSPFQDVANVGRQVQTGLGGVYNALQGYAAPVSPMPWKNQLPESNNINILKY
jgi:hypothetical protein